MGRRKREWIPVNESRYWLHLSTGYVWWERYIVPSPTGERVQMGKWSSQQRTLVRRDSLAAPYWMRTARPHS